MRTDGCQSGELDLGGLNCVTCPPGYACGFNTTLAMLSSAKCISGSFCPAGSATPTSAPAGSFVPGGGYAVALPCAQGSYTSYTGASTCTVCPNGQTTTDAGAASAAECMPLTCSEAGPLLGVIFVSLGALLGAGCTVVVQALCQRSVRKMKSAILPVIKPAHGRTTAESQAASPSVRRPRATQQV